MYYCCGISDVGSVRTHNEDAFLINKIVMTHAQLECNNTRPFIAAVADGVAGESSGEIASKLCLDTLSKMEFNTKTDLKHSILEIHEVLRKYGIENNDSLNMQTTLCAVAVDENNCAYSLNIGDSRLYRLSGNTLTQLTKDQSLVELLFDAGEITSDEKWKHAKRNIIFPVLGNVVSPPVPEIIQIGEILPCEILLLCTDGLSDYVTEPEILAVLTQSATLIKKISALVELAIHNGSNDNITIVAISINEE